MEQGSLDKGSTKCSEFSRLRTAPCRSGGVNTLLTCHIEVLNRTFRNWRTSLHSDSSKMVINISSGRSFSLSADCICIPSISVANEGDLESKEVGDEYSQREGLATRLTTCGTGLFGKVSMLAGRKRVTPPSTLVPNQE